MRDGVQLFGAPRRPAINAVVFSGVCDLMGEHSLQCVQEVSAVLIHRFDLSFCQPPASVHEIPVQIVVVRPNHGAERDYYLILAGGTSTCQELKSSLVFMSTPLHPRGYRGSTDEC